MPAARQPLASAPLRAARLGALRLAALLLLVGSQVGLDCAPPLIVSIGPADGSVVTTFGVPIEIQLGAAADPSTLVVELNGVDVTAQLGGGPTLYTATIGPGAPLLDDNELVVRVRQAPREGVGTVRPIAFQYLPPKARAFEVTDASQCPTGPLAHCTVGDFVLANSEARFVVQKANQRELHFTGTYGGNLIDAETVVDGVPQGNDSFYEIQPSVNIESVINATVVEVVNDGQDGTAAIVRACGPDDLLDDINPSSVIEDAGGIFPPGVDDQDYDVVGCNEYRLEPQTRILELTTTIENMEASQLGLYVGDYINASGELEQFSPLAPSALTPIGRAGVGELFANWGIRTMSFYGFGAAEGVDYGLVVPQPPSGTSTPVCLPGVQDPPCPSSSFTQSGVSFVLHGNSIPLVLFFGAGSSFVVPAGGAKSFARWFTVGDGSAANSVQALADVTSLQSGTVRGCVTDAGSQAPLAGARVMAASDIDGGAPSADIVRTHWVTGADGCYEARVPVGTYFMAAAKEGYPYEGGGTTPQLHPVTVTDGGTVVQDFVLPATGRLRVEVVDHEGQPMPGRLAVVGFDPSPEVTLFASVVSANDVRSGLFYDVEGDPVPTALTRTEYTDASGVIEIDHEPGTYQVSVSRGYEYSAYTEQVVITAGATTTVQAQLAKVVESPGFISSDYHVHMLASPDSRVSHEQRIRSFAGEGVDNIIATDHAAVTDLMPEIAALGFGPFVHATPGEEITTFDYGHYNAYPQGLDPTQPQTKGATDHAGAAPPGQNFPAYGHYNLSPAEIEAAVYAKPQNAGLDTIVQINHITGHFTPLKIDTSLSPPASQLGPGEPEIFRLDPSISNFFHPFPALELWNGMTIGHQNEFLVDRIGIWVNLLNQGILATAVADTDTHEIRNLRSGGARSWTPSSTDDPAGIVDQEIGRAVRAGKLVGGQGLYVQTRLLATDGSGGVASFEGPPPSGTQPATAAAGTLLSVANGEVQLEIRVQAPTWAEYDRIEIYRNAATQVTGTNGAVPVAFTAIPTTVLNAGTDFTVATVPVNGDARLETVHTVTLSGLTEDEWIAVIVKGTQGVSKPMFPVQPSGISLAQNPTLADLMDVTAAENGIRALGYTNALYVDVDQNGVFDAPGVRVMP